MLGVTVVLNGVGISAGVAGVGGFVILVVMVLVLACPLFDSLAFVLVVACSLLYLMALGHVLACSLYCWHCGLFVIVLDGIGIGVGCWGWCSWSK